jgi:hypothetical protein
MCFIQRKRSECLYLRQNYKFKSKVYWMGYVTRGMNQDIWSGKLLLVLASIVILRLLSDDSGGLQSLFLSRIRMSA